MSDMKRLLSGAYMLGYIDARNDKAIDPIGAIKRLTMNLNKSDLINRQDAIDAVMNLPDCENGYSDTYDKACIIGVIEDLPSAEPEDYTEMKREFIRMTEYIDVLLVCSDKQKETLIGFISRLAEFMPWTERD